MTPSTLPKRITKGTVEVEVESDGQLWIIPIDSTTPICKINQAEEENGDIITTEADNAHAELITEAFNVTNQTGFTPKELAEQNEKLVEALKDTIIDVTKWCTELKLDCTKYSTWIKAKEAIQSTTKTN